MPTQACALSGERKMTPSSRLQPGAVPSRAREILSVNSAGTKTGSMTMLFVPEPLRPTLYHTSRMRNWPGCSRNIRASGGLPSAPGRSAPTIAQSQ